MLFDYQGFVFWRNTSKYLYFGMQETFFMAIYEIIINSVVKVRLVAKF